ncbi:hypothetical protein ATCC90586_005001 [Pythium insidiosum]|nr:hypothetical protein ATCC90586_005001 [Pythium insidiosum]
MGKNRHSKDRLFVTATEHKYLYGGKKPDVKRAYRRLPFNCCAITLTPFSHPVATREGHVFDLEAIVPFVKAHGINPVTGAALALKDLVTLQFHRNSQGEFFCPVTYKVFTDNTKIAAIATTGNVFAFDAIDELNIKPKNWTDLLTGDAFKRKDVIVLQDPQDLSSREITNFAHLRRAAATDSAAAATSATQRIRTNAATDRILQELEAKRAEQRALADKIRRGDSDGVSERDKIVATLTHSASSVVRSGGDDDSATGGVRSAAQRTDGSCAQAFTSSALAPVTQNAVALASEEEVRETRWRAVRRLKKKGLVAMDTSLGCLTLEIHCDMVPQTADNFMGLCRKGYYDGVLFHRVIKGFMLQGGDPTGTGRGGESLWKSPFRDEFDSRLSHDARGVLSMANAGPGTNRSQFFITFKATPHLDKKHSVFGRVVAGFETLDAFESQVDTDAQDRPRVDVKITAVTILEDPFKEFEDALARGEDAVALAKEAALRKRQNRDDGEVKGAVLKVGDQWIAYDNVDDAAVLAALKRRQQTSENGHESSSSVGRYLQSKGEPEVSKKRRVDENEVATMTTTTTTLPSGLPAPIASKKKSKTSSQRGGFGDFSGW